VRTPTFLFILSDHHDSPMRKTLSLHGLYCQNCSWKGVSVVTAPLP
jgi:hypothetical protein